MEISLAQQAINLALLGKWEEATVINLQILVSDPKNIDALNRLARTYAEVGKIDLAKNTAERVLEIDPNNTIAIKCLDKWKMMKKGDVHFTKTSSAGVFLEESGKTKLITLVNPGDRKVFAGLDSGDEVKILSHAHTVSIATQDGKYIGKIPDDSALKIRNAIKSGAKFQVYIKSIDLKDITIFIRSSIFLFPVEKLDYVSFTPPELVHKTSVDVGLELPEEF